MRIHNVYLTVHKLFARTDNRSCTIAYKELRAEQEAVQISKISIKFYAHSIFWEIFFSFFLYFITEYNACYYMVSLPDIFRRFLFNIYIFILYPRINKNILAIFFRNFILSYLNWFSQYICHYGRLSPILLFSVCMCVI